ncbi:hypothetical protein GZH47_33790 (plasmid) [Paenibacillus rhizovicinus]|uniref:Ig-like domain-containing protein n=1 Tax=Paenibacillus rhizovicinus TaxID=2704463 RepID=A0A6C0PCM5_9BACL|nr:hypothetical protein [Paenibacillus rhizovicinus]QHW35863.1 hypothetical protein GZH47_33790 [Paenibacillus rhizovicinus]
MSEKYTSPILKGFTIKAYLQGEASDSQASSRRAYEDAGDGDEVIDPPYFPPSPPSAGDPPPPPDPDEHPQTPPPVDDDGDEPDPDHPELNVRITNKLASLCHGDQLPVSGVVDGPFGITKVVLLINGEVVEEKKGVGDRTEMAYNFKVPTDKYLMGGTISIEVKGYDSKGNVDTDSYVLSLKDCTIPPPPVKVRDCMLFDTLLVQYYHRDTKTLESIDIPYDWLPYELDNGNGDKVTFGWNAANNGVIVMMTESYDSSGTAFQLSSIGVVYKDNYDKEITTWAAAVASKSNGAKNVGAMLGEPSSKNPSVWITAAQNGDFSTAPAIGAQNDYVIFTFDADFTSKHCLISHDFKPGDHTKDLDLTDPPVEPYDPDNGPQRDCLLWDGIIVQFYDPNTDKLERAVIPMDGLGSTPVMMGDVKMMIGWSDMFNGVTVMVKQLKEGAGSYNAHVTGVAIKFSDYYGNSKEAWSQEVAFATEGTRHYELMVGEPKEIVNCPWISEIKAGNYANAPSMMNVNDYVAFKFMEEFTNNHCPIDDSKQNDDDIGIDPANPPNVPHVYIEPFPFSHIQACIMDAIQVKGYAEDFDGLKEVKFFFTGDLIDMSPYRIIGTGQKRIDFNFTINTSSLQPGDYRVTGWATNNSDQVSPTVVSTPNKPIMEFTLMNCSPDITISTLIDTCNDVSWTFSGSVSAQRRIKSYKVVDNLGRTWTQQNVNGSTTTGSYSITVPANTYTGGQTITLTATVEDMEGRTDMATTTIFRQCTPPPTIDAVVSGIECSNKDLAVGMNVIGGDSRGVSTVKISDTTGHVWYTGNGAFG